MKEGGVNVSEPPLLYMVPPLLAFWGGHFRAQQGPSKPDLVLPSLSGHFRYDFSSVKKKQCKQGWYLWQLLFAHTKDPTEPGKAARP